MNGARRYYKRCRKSVATESAATLVCSPNGVSSSYLANAKWFCLHYCHHTCHWSVDPVEITWELALCVWQVTPCLSPHNCVSLPDGRDSSSEPCDTGLFSETLVWPSVSLGAKYSLQIKHLRTFMSHQMNGPVLFLALLQWWCHCQHAGQDLCFNYGQWAKRRPVLQLIPDKAGLDSGPLGLVFTVTHSVFLQQTHNSLMAIQ